MIRIALAGNQNSGKTTLFNRLTGMNQTVGNWPGVTVEKKEGPVEGHDGVTVTDLPGVYSLSPYTSEEMVSRKFLIGERPDVILNIVDGTNIERNLYLTTQLCEIGIPVVVAVNMMDLAEKRGDRLDTDALATALGVRVFKISALKGNGVGEAVDAAIEEAEKGGYIPPHIFSGITEHAVAHIEEAVLHSYPANLQRWYSVKLFERDADVRKTLGVSDEVLSHIESDIAAAEKEYGDDSESIITNERYDYVSAVLKKCYVKHSLDFLTRSARIDSVVTGRLTGLPVFAAVMFLVYFLSVSLVGGPVTRWAEDGLFGSGWWLFSERTGVFVPGIPDALFSLLSSVGCAGWLADLVVNGIVGGVGSVLGFVPQLMVLFFFLAFLESCGYMARIAFILDRFFHNFGLSGKSFIPLLVGSGCGVPGIMSSRTIENQAERRMTVMTVTFVPCSAKLPVIALISSAFFAGKWWVAPSAYLMGIASVALSGVILKKFSLFGDQNSPFVMELPDYHLPSFATLWRTVWDRTASFVKKAGTVILLFSVAVWALSRIGVVGGKVAFSLSMGLDDSFIGRAAGAIKWLFAPLGFGRVVPVVASVLGIVAKEEIVSVVQLLGGSAVLDFTKASAYSFLAFNLLCVPCVACIAAIRREMGSVRWTLFAVAYQCAYAYFVALVINQWGSFFSGCGNLGGFVVSSLAVLVFAFLLFRCSGVSSGVRK